MIKQFCFAAVCFAAFFGLSSCMTTGKPFVVGAGYDEKKNVDVTAAEFRMNAAPADVLQVYRNVAKSDGKVSYGIYNTFRDSFGSTRPHISVAAFIVDGTRVDFYSKSFGYEDISENLVKKTSENGYFFASKPALGNSLVATEQELITDPDPAATDAAIVNLFNSFKKAQSITIKLFGDRTNAPVAYTYSISPDDLAALKQFCNTVTSSK